MRMDAIQTVVNSLKKQYHSSNPFHICMECGIKVLQRPMGNHAQSCKGFFLVNARCKIIVLNSDLPECIQRVILAHELGHATLHSVHGISAFHEFSVLDETNRMEYEANMFAAELLLPDDDVYDEMNRETDIFDAASSLMVPPEMLEFKLRILQKKDYQIRIPMYASGDFLKKEMRSNKN